MKHLFSIFIILFFIFPIFAQDKPTKVQEELTKFINSEELTNAAISFLAINLTNGDTLAIHNSNMAIPAASTSKLFTTATAFEVLGKDYKPKTNLFYQGTIDSSGVLHGDIIIQGLGDPSLGSLYFYKTEEQNQFLTDWIEAITKIGIKNINGRIIADGSAFGYQGVPDGWSWSDLGNYYGAGPSACALYDNTTKLHFSTSNQLGGPTFLDSLTPEIPGFYLDNKVTTYAKSSDNAYIYGAPFSNNRFAIGNLPRNKQDFIVKASIPDPELLLAQTIETALINANFSITLPAEGFRTISQFQDTVFNYKNMTPILTYEGKSVEQIAYWVNMRSVNFFAEQLLCLIGMEKANNGETSNSIWFLNNYWSTRLKIPMFQRDGSGLSRSNGFSATHFVKLLTYMHSSKNFTDFEATLPTAGESGTLRSICRGQTAQGKLKAKSGTMNKIKSYAGYVDSKTEQKIAFAIIVNNYDLTNVQLVKKMEKIFNSLADI